MHERDKDEIRHYIDTMFRAYTDKDWTNLCIGHTENWCGFTVDSRSIIRTTQAYVTDTEAALEGVELVDYEMIDIDYVFYDATCVVPYIARLRGTWATGELFEVKLRALDVYVEQDGNWRQIASNVSLHPDTRVTSEDAATPLFRPPGATQATAQL